MFPLPESPTDGIRLADWLELRALAAQGLSSSRADLESALKQASVVEPKELDEKLLEVFHELEQRRKATGGNYPFTIDAGVVQSRTDWQAAMSYVFCLCLSYVRWARPKGTSFYPERVFECLCTAAAREFVAGAAVRFGSPRAPKELPKGFGKALDALCGTHIREGDGFNGHQVAWSKDYGLDVVAWRDWKDGLPGKLLLFGACASGNDWVGKLNELRPDEFCADWLQTKPPSPIVKAFFLPHRLPQHPWDRRKQEWERNTRSAGIIFDRCRIASLTSNLPTEESRALAWVNERLESLRTGTAVSRTRRRKLRQ